jgi:hypothetical protein
MEKSELSELRVTVRLIEKNREIATLEKCFGFVETEDEKEDAQMPAKTIDETITEFLQEIESKARESGRIVSKEELAKVTVATILFLVKRSQPELNFDIEVEKQENGEREDADSKSDT